MREILESDAFAVSGILLLLTATGIVVHRLLFSVLSRLRGDGLGTFARAFARRCFWASLALIVAASATFGLALVDISERSRGHAQHAVALLAIASVAWLVVRLTDAGEDLVLDRFDISGPDNRRARKVRTQAIVLQRIVAVVVTILAGAAMLTTFPQVRVMGTSILASAGIAGLIIGLAAQSTLANLFAGIQIALTDPIRIDDVVVVEGEWGRIEEITFTYVVVRVWDERRLILPISHFANRPFENWTRNRAEILGSVYLHVDYTVPVGKLRGELERLAADSPLWDGRVAALQVTGASDRAIEVRALVSAADSPTAWDLRCHVREGLIDYLRAHHPETLPRIRAELLTNGPRPA